ncbi:MAG: hypothetical protein HC822_11940 [Oscillochloris sp.]|nr:hypothetical protein [Oscillochloris sp.]
MISTKLLIANYTLNLSLDARGQGTLVRLPDQVEASFNTYECLLVLLEGILGKRFWNAHREQLVATCNALVAGI